jgi:hypothetical protein
MAIQGSQKKTGKSVAVENCQPDHEVLNPKSLISARAKPSIGPHPSHLSMTALRALMTANNVSEMTGREAT